MAETGYTSYANQGVGDHLLQEGKDTPVVSDIVSGVQDVSKGDIAGLAGDIAGFADNAATALADPLNALISAGLGFLMDVISPLRDLLQQVTGDADALDKAKESFGEIGKDVAKLASELDDITRTGFQNWTGAAKDAAGAKVDTFVKGVQGTANNAEDVSQLLGISATLMEAAYNLVMGIISDCIDWLIVTWVAALAAEIPTCGASTAAAGAATTAEVGVEGANAGEKVEQATSLVEKITTILKKIMSELKKLKSATKDAHATLKDGKDVTKAARDVTKEAKEAEKAAKAAKEAKKASGVADTRTLAQKAKDFGKEHLDKQIDEKWTQPKENLSNLIHNPKGVLQNLAKDREPPGKFAINTAKDLGKEAAVDVGKSVFTTISGDLLDQVAPGSDPVASARVDGPDGWLESGQTTGDLQG